MGTQCGESSRMQTSGQLENAKFAAEVNVVANHHNHTFTYERKKLKTCRLSYEQLIVSETQVRQLDSVDNDDGSPAYKPHGMDAEHNSTMTPVVDPPPKRKLPHTSNPLYVDDDRVIVIDMKRETKSDQFQVDANETITALLRCNTAVYNLTTSLEQKIKALYISNQSD